jgi:hypothetical protein
MGGQRLSDGRLWNREKVECFKELLLLGRAGTAALCGAFEEA